MYCNESIHFHFKEASYIECPFCYKQIQNPNPQTYKSCDNMNISNNNCLVCKSCGTVKGYKPVKEFIDFYENRYRIKRKSVYHRKYHITGP